MDREEGGVTWAICVHVRVRVRVRVRVHVAVGVSDLKSVNQTVSWLVHWHKWFSMYTNQLYRPAIPTSYANQLCQPALSYSDFSWMGWIDWETIKCFFYCCLCRNIC